MSVQQSLFGAPVIDPTPVSPVRRSDPDTSHQAARESRKLRNSQRTQLLRVYANDDAVSGEGLNDEEAAVMVGLDRVAATRRLSQLRAHGWIIDTGLRRPTSTGCMAMVCCITPDGWKALRS